MNQEQAEEFTQALGMVVGGSWRLIKQARALGVPKALGVTVDEWVNKRLGGYVKMAAEERRGPTLEMKAEGMSNRAIGEVLGVDEGTIRNDFRAENSAGDDAAPEGKDNASAENSAPLDTVAALAASDKVRKLAARSQSREKIQSAAGNGNGGRVHDLAQIAAAGVRCGTIYADPPWQYGNQSTRGATEDHYVGMSVDEICALPIEQLAAADAHLHLWTTNAFLFEAQRVIAAWGFEYRSTFVWVKPQIGMGNYWRVSHEFLLLGIRGSAKFADKTLRSWGEFPRRQHSQKPEEIRALIERAGAGPRLELFARRLAPGWYTWGNEITRSIFDAEEISA